MDRNDFVMRTLVAGVVLLTVLVGGGALLWSWFTARRERLLNRTKSARWIRDRLIRSIEICGGSREPGLPPRPNAD